MKKTYQFSRIVEGYIPITVEAESLVEAMKIAKEMPVDMSHPVQTQSYVQFEGTEE